MVFSIIIWINMILDQANLAVTIIGWIQFGLLTITIGLPLLMLLIVLVIPMKYDLKGALCEAKEFPDEEGAMEDEISGAGDIVSNIKGMLYNVTEHISGKGKFSWLSGLVKGEMSYKDKELSWKAKIFVKKLSSEGYTQKVEDSEEGIEAEDSGKKSSVSIESIEPEKKSGVGIESNQRKKKSSASLEGNEPKKKSGVGIESNQRKKKSGASLEGNEPKKKSSVGLENRQDVNISKKDKVQERVSKEPTQIEMAERKDKKKEDEYARKAEYGKGDTHKDESDNIVDEDQGFFEKIEEGYVKINEKMEYTYEQICDKIDLVTEGKEKISQFIHEETHQEAYDVLVKRLIKLLRVVKPTKVVGNLKIGFENPETTGFFVAGASLIYPYVSKSINLEADFEQKVLEGDWCVKGKLRLGSLAWFATKMATNKNVQVTIKDIIKIVPKDLNIKKT